MKCAYWEGFWGYNNWEVDRWLNCVRIFYMKGDLEGGIVQFDLSEFVISLYDNLFVVGCPVYGCVHIVDCLGFLYIMVEVILKLLFFI